MKDFISHPDDTGRVRSSSTSFVAPTACPACHSPSILTHAKNPSPDSYWRCTACGEVWNVKRDADRGGQRYR